MDTRRTQTLILNEEESMRFARSIFMPTADEIDRFNLYSSQIDRSITINELDDGFEAIIPDLDLPNESMEQYFYLNFQFPDHSSEYPLPLINDASIYHAFYEAVSSALVNSSSQIIRGDHEMHKVAYTITKELDSQSAINSEPSVQTAA